VRFARVSWTIPIPALATTMPRKSASRGSPNASVSAPNATRIALKTVTTLATTMLVYERLVAGARGPPAAARRAAASCSERPISVEPPRVALR
jgi:hypothetical protein